MRGKCQAAASCAEPGSPGPSFPLKNHILLTHSYHTMVCMSAPIHPFSLLPLMWVGESRVREWLDAQTSLAPLYGSADLPTNLDPIPFFIVFFQSFSHTLALVAVSSIVQILLPRCGTVHNSLKAHIYAFKSVILKHF